MDAELKARLTRYLDKLEAAVTNTADFAVDQAPDVVREWLAWEFWSNAASAITAFAVITFLAWLARLLVGYINDEIKKEKMPGAKKSETAGFAFMCFLVVSVLVVAITIAWLAPTAARAVKATVAPKVVVLERVAELIKGK